MHPEEIKAALRMEGMTQAALADEFGVAASTVNKVISGHSRSRRIQNRISQILGKSVNTIWPNQVVLRRTREEIEAQRARASA